MKTKAKKSPYTTLRAAKAEYEQFRRRAMQSYPRPDLLDMIRGLKPIPAHEGSMIERFTYSHGHAPETVNIPGVTRHLGGYANALCPA